MPQVSTQPSTLTLNCVCLDRSHERAKSSGVTRKDLEQMADAIGPEFVHQRTNEKEELKGLNNRFARYLKRVQAHCLYFTILD